MSVQSQINRLESLRNTIRTKLVALGLASSSDGMDTLATALNGIADRGAISQSLNAGDSYTIPAGYHNGSGKVTANSLASQTDGTAGAADILSGKTAYVDGVKVTGNIPSKAAATITPGTSDQSMAAGQYLSGKQTIKGDANLVAENIAEGVSIFGVEGTLAAGSQIVYGTVVPSSLLKISQSNPYTVTGLPFTPSKVLVYFTYAGMGSTSSTYPILLIDSNPLTAFYFHYKYNAGAAVCTTGNIQIITHNSDGFTIAPTGSLAGYITASYPMEYIAIK